MGRWGLGTYLWRMRHLRKRICRLFCQQPSRLESRRRVAPDGSAPSGLHGTGKILISRFRTLTKSFVVQTSYILDHPRLVGSEAVQVVGRYGPKTSDGARASHIVARAGAPGCLRFDLWIPLFRDILGCILCQRALRTPCKILTSKRAQVISPHEAWARGSGPSSAQL